MAIYVTPFYNGFTEIYTTQYSNVCNFLVSRYLKHFTSRIIKIYKGIKKSQFPKKQDLPLATLTKKLFPAKCF